MPCDQYSPRLEESTPLDEVATVLAELTELAMQRLTFDDRLHGDDDRDFDLLRFLHTNQQ